ncbi:MAG TPA: EAL domain-containing protein, partial [Anaerolineales bacterium]
YFSPRWKAMLGFSESEVGSAPEEWFSRVHPDDRDQVQIDLAAHLDGLNSHFESEHRMQDKSGSYRWVLTRGLAVRDADGLAYRMAGSQTDITERKLAEEQILHDALHDRLTGLPNRALFTDRLWHAVERFERNPADRFAVLFLDLDRFKVINDSLGHNTGDRLLVETARRLGALLYSADTLARLGGDEFIILLEEIASPEEAIQVANRIQEDLKQPFQLEDRRVFISTSIGIVHCAPGYERSEEILRDADIALYRAKAEGKAGYCVFEPAMRVHAMSRLELEGELRLAIERHELRVHYQPILSLQTDRIIGFEALLRWSHPRQGLVPPAEFIPLAEETGLILPIGRWVLAQACEQLRHWQQLFPADPPLMMSVNISGRQFADPFLFEQIEQTLAESGLDPTSLRLEITENLLVENSWLPLKVLNKLRDLGIQLLIDDFGTGYSSLGYVQRFPINTIKIDRLFVECMQGGSDRSEIARTIVALARNLGLDTIAEGVETPEQLAQLKDLECELWQGFLFSEALDPSSVETLLCETFSPGRQGKA